MKQQTSVLVSDAITSKTTVVYKVTLDVDLKVGKTLDILDNPSDILVDSTTILSIVYEPDSATDTKDLKNIFSQEYLAFIKDRAIKNLLSQSLINRNSSKYMNITYRGNEILSITIPGIIDYNIVSLFNADEYIKILKAVSDETS